MAFEQISDADSTTVGGGGYTAGSGSLQVANSAGANGGFPAVPNFRVSIRDASTKVVKALLKVTAIPDGTHLTVTSDGLDANASSGDAVENVLTTNGLRARLSQNRQIGTFANLPATTTGLTDGDTYDQTDGPYRWRFNGSVWVPSIVGVGLVTLPPSSGWTWDNQGTSTSDSTNGFLRLLGARASTLRVYYRTAPSTPYTVTTLVRVDVTGAGASGVGTQSGLGFGFRDSGGKLVMMKMSYEAPLPQISMDKWNSATSFSANYATFNSGAYSSWITSARQGIWFRVTDDGTNLVFNWSLDGSHWNQLFSSSRTNFMASGPNAYGIFGYCTGDSADINMLSLVES